MRIFFKFGHIIILLPALPPVTGRCNYRETGLLLYAVGGMVADAAIELHKDFAYKLQNTIIRGKGKFEGQRVKNNYVLSDGDMTEFHV